MVVCKYFQQGNCRFGQYCRFEHVGGFGGNGQSSAHKSYGDNKSNVLAVAEEVLAAERSGQWLLSCFGPFKEQGCIPGMEDVSPEEVRWEIYQAQKNGNVEQTKLQFQQLCQAMTRKREALKNPTHETADMLDKLQKFQGDSSFSSKSNFVLSTPQLSTSSITGNSFFAPKSFGTPSSGSFSEKVNATPVTQASIFSHSNTNTTSFFGAAPAFGAFGVPQTSNSIFGGSTKPMTSMFGNSQPLGTFSPTSSVAATSGAVPQASNQNLFSANQPQNSIFATSQSTSVFGGGSQGVDMFGGETITQQTGAPIFGSSSNSIFGQPKNNMTFGTAPVFGASGSGFGKTNAAPVFGAPGTFSNNPAALGMNMSSPFGASPGGTNGFANVAPSNHSPFTNTNNTVPFGTNNSTGASNLADNSLLGKLEMKTPGGAGHILAASSLATSQPESSNASIPAGFGNPIDPPENFSNRTSNPFISSSTTATANNPFLTKSQLSSDTFTQSPFSRPANNEVIDETIYSTEQDLSDNDKKMFLAASFTLGEISMRAPTIELR
ncbi:nuclear pore complex protein DDB_G0274915-like isoform X2 [Diachasmimorpha longicaudata]|uniref:nuclear pore complex protein DDB_G0274915-like isoform X2 n=1 Tax=Diachasmimorpha longicaudata TaxID=58733 RepID=UPI0030B8903E